MKYTFRLFVLIYFCSATLLGQKNYDKNDSITLDASIRYGKLENGFTYYIKPLKKSQKKTKLSFLVKAGSNQQDMGQLDVAHAVEHIAFTATENFPNKINNEDLLESLKMSVYDINASSGYWTQYQFNAPEHMPQALDTALVWFNDIANGLKFSKANVERVRGELRQEFLSKNGDNLEGASIDSKLESALFPGREDNTNYLEFNNKFSAESLKKFYLDWYKPSLMAISIVGNIPDIDNLERRIISTFEDLHQTSGDEPYKNHLSQYHKRLEQFIKVGRSPYSNKDFKDGAVTTKLYFRKKKPTGSNNWRILKEEVVWGILADILQHRLKDKGQKFRCFFNSTARFPFKNGQSPNIPALAIEIRSQDNSEVQGLKETMGVVHQIRKFGATLEEWKTFKRTSKVDDESSDYWVEQLMKHFIYKEPLPSNKNLRLKNWLNNLTLENFNQTIKVTLSKMPEDIGMIVPKDHKAMQYSEQQVRSWIMESYNSKITPFSAPGIKKDLNDQGDLGLLKKKEATSIKRENTGSKEILMENGIKVILKSFKPTGGDKNIWVKGFSPIGASCFPSEDFYSAVHAPRIVRNSGFGTMDKFEINRFLSEKKNLQGPTSYIDYNETAIQGKASSIEELEILLQMVYLYFVYPRKDKAAYKDWQKKEYINFINPTNTNTIADDFSNNIRNLTGDSTVSGDGIFGIKYLRGTESFRGMQQTKFDRALQIYKNLFGQARNFTFIINGDFPEETVLPLVQKYLGNLPNNNNNFLCSPKSMSTWDSTKSPSLVEISSAGNYGLEGVYYYFGFISNKAEPTNWKEQIQVYALGWYIYQQVMKLRFEKGFALYGFGSEGRLNKNLDRYEIYIKLFGKKDEIKLLKKACREIIADIKSGNVDDKTFSSSTRRLYNIYSEKTALRNRDMQKNLYNHYRYDIPWFIPDQVMPYVKNITKEDLTITANKYLKKANLIEVVMED